MTIFAALFGFAAFAAMPSYDTLIAHRGESVDAPENSLPAYQTAVERGFGFGCDVYLSKDGRVFTFHDRDLKRTTGGENTNKCADVTCAELEAVDVGNWGKWMDSRFKGTRPATWRKSSRSPAPDGSMNKATISFQDSGVRCYKVVRWEDLGCPVVGFASLPQKKHRSRQTTFAKGTIDRWRRNMVKC